MMHNANLTFIEVWQVRKLSMQEKMFWSEETKIELSVRVDEKMDGALLEQNLLEAPENLRTRRVTFQQDKNLKHSAEIQTYPCVKALQSKSRPESN